MKLVFDAAKDEHNRAKHGISLARAADIDLAAVLVDDRRDYGEVRYRGFGFIDRTAYCLVFTVRESEVRAISLRRAHAKEMSRYVG